MSYKVSSNGSWTASQRREDSALAGRGVDTEPVAAEAIPAAAVPPAYIS